MKEIPIRGSVSAIDAPGMQRASDSCCIPEKITLLAQVREKKEEGKHYKHIKTQKVILLARLLQKKKGGELYKHNDYRGGELSNHAE